MCVCVHCYTAVDWYPGCLAASVPWIDSVFSDPDQVKAMAESAQWGWNNSSELSDVAYFRLILEHRDKWHYSSVA